MGSVIVVVLCLGLKWLQNETWYLIDEKIPLSLWTRRPISNEFRQEKKSEFWGFFKYIAFKLENSSPSAVSDKNWITDKPFVDESSTLILDLFAQTLKNL